MNNKSSLKKQLKKVNFELMLDTIQDADLIYSKFKKIVTSITLFLRNIALMYNDMKGNELQQIKDYIVKNKLFLTPFSEFKKKIEGWGMVTTEDNDELMAQFRLLCLSPLIDTLMYTVRVLEPKKALIDLNNDWILTSMNTSEPFKECDISLYFLYSKNKSALNRYLKSISTHVDDFYTAFVSPNFNLDAGVDTICQVLEELNRRKEVICDSIPSYIRKIATSGTIDMQELNLQYLQTSDPNIFVMYLLDVFLSPKEDCALTKRQLGQIKGLMIYLREKQAHNSMVLSSLEAGIGIATMEEESIERHQKNKSHEDL